MAYCKTCGGPIDSSKAVVCPTCGAPLGQTPSGVVESWTAGTIGESDPTGETFSAMPPPNYNPDAVDHSNPYAPPTVECQPRAPLNYRALATSMKQVNISFLLILLIAGAPLFRTLFLRYAVTMQGQTPQGDTLIQTMIVFGFVAWLGLWFGSRIWLLVASVKLLSEAGNGIALRLFTAILAVPFPLLAVLIAETVGGKRLKAAGYKPGFFWPNMRQFD